MNLERITLLLILTFLGYNTVGAQQLPHAPGQVLVSLQPNLRPESLIRRTETQFAVTDIRSKKIAGLMNVWLLQADIVENSAVLDWLRRQPEVVHAQYNFLAGQRSSPPVSLLPNDPLFSQQWQYVNTGANGGTPNADLDAELAWEITTGGLTPAGDTIVVAVIDGGIDQNHTDLIHNLWKNRGETPNDGIDNDNNGYIDDFRGWNVVEENDQISGVGTGHGTPVSGIVGAKGNNANGVTGVNWNVKIMFVAGSSSQAEIIAAYDYVLQARKRYNETNGQSGAFVVAVNCSWGTDYGHPADAPLWCAAFDSLGKEGILSIAATANIPVDVDVVGDLPTTCPSEYLVAVTNLNNADLKAPLAGWGFTNIDLGAYGQGVYTTGSDNSYGIYYGTSFAAPQVSGAIGLLYSAPCPNLITLAKNDPAAAAAWTKTLLLNSTVPVSSMQGITVTGGRLNLYTLLQDYEDQCSPCPPPFALKTENIGTGSALLKWFEVSDFQSVTLHWRQSGSNTWNNVGNVENAYLLENLSPCTTYEFALSAECGPGISSDWSTTASFTTDGCCTAPAAVWATDIHSTDASLAWTDITAANAYKVRIRLLTGSWQTYTAGATATFVIPNLLPCTDYEVAVQTICDTGATAFSASLFFKTAGCGSCTDAQYCPAKSTNANDEWIKSVSIGAWTHETSNGGGGYQNFAGSLYPIPKLILQTPESVTIEPGFQGLPYKEFFRVYIDFNMDGDFEDADELAFSPAWASENPVSGQISPPAFASEGITRMRVMMKYKGSGSIPPAPCEIFEYGQVEDYCVELAFNANVPVRFVESASTPLRIYPQPASESVWLDLPGETGEIWQVSVWDMRGVLLASTSETALEGLISLPVSDWPTGLYTVQAFRGDRVLQGRVMKGN